MWVKRAREEIARELNSSVVTITSKNRQGKAQMETEGESLAVDIFVNYVKSRRLRRLTPGSEEEEGAYSKAV